MIPLPRVGPRAAFALLGAAAVATDVTTTVPAEVLPQPPPGDCPVIGYYYTPQYQHDFLRTSEESWEACQKRCFEMSSCTFFGYWPDGGCTIQSSSARLVSAQTQCPANMSVPCEGREVVSGPKACTEGYFSLYPNTGKAQEAMPLEPASYDCTQTGVWYEGGIREATIEASWKFCRQRCFLAMGCESWAFWPDGKCLLQDNVSAELVDGKRWCETESTTSPSACGGTKVISAKQKCIAPSGDKCTQRGYYYGIPEPSNPQVIFTTSFEECQISCAVDILNCWKVSYWPDGSCVKVDAFAALKSGAERCVNFTGSDASLCPGLLVVSGPQQCGPGYFHLYPHLGAEPETSRPVHVDPGEPEPAQAAAAETTPKPAQFLSDLTPQDDSSFSDTFIFGGGTLAFFSAALAMAWALGAFGDGSEKKKKKKKSSRNTYNEMPSEE